MASVSELLRRQKALADFGDFVLDHDDMQAVLDEGCRLIAFALHTDLAKVLEIDAAMETALVRAGVGWRPGIVGKEVLSLTERSSEAFAIERGEPVITNDLACETRFHFPPFLMEHGVIALVNVPIFLPGRKPWGVLQVDARERREFDQADIEFLKTYSMVLGPVVDRLQKLDGLRESEARYRGLVTAGKVSTYRMSPDWKLMYQLDGENLAITSEPLEGWAERYIVEEDRPRLFAAVEEAIRTKSLFELEHRVLLEDGSVGWVLWRAVPLLNDDGDIAEWFGAGTDITERKRGEEALRQSERHAKLLLAELQHRVRNTLAVVRSIARRTSETSASAEDMLAHFQGRLDAFSRVQAMVTRDPDGGVDLKSIIEDELVAHAARDGEQVRIHGPDLLLDTKAAERLSLAIHELTTNAIKHGALSTERGQITIGWRTTGEDGRAQLELEWIESGIEVAPVDHEGFGMELLRHSLPYDLRATTEVELAPDGLRFSLRMPLPGMTEIKPAA